jgi:hypothetical protein
MGKATRDPNAVVAGRSQLCCAVTAPLGRARALLLLRPTAELPQGAAAGDQDVQAVRQDGLHLLVSALSVILYGTITVCLSLILVDFDGSFGSV